MNSSAPGRINDLIVAVLTESREAENWRVARNKDPIRNDFLSNATNRNTTDYLLWTPILKADGDQINFQTTIMMIRLQTTRCRSATKMRSDSTRNILETVSIFLSIVIVPSETSI